MDLRYPIGLWNRKSTMSSEERRECIDTIASMPSKLRAAVAGLSDAQLDTPYREGGWTVRQVVHHVPDSHLNAYIRTKLALTESEPTIKPYDEAAWANLADSTLTPIETSLALLEALHVRWVALLRALAPDDFARALFHPDNGRMTMDSIVSMYAWHGAHHTAHITALRERMGW
jgi:uncharacterized damage-inducible protein DinB